MPFAEIARFLVRGLKARFRDQKCEFDVIRRHVGPGDLVCDVGANKGSFVWWLSRWCRDGRVIAFEPQPAFAARLAAVCRSLKLENVTVEAKAVHSRSGAQDLFVPAGHSPGASLTQKAVEATSFTTLSVPVVALDDYFAESDKVALLKIDVEGAELGVLQGAERILRQHAPLLVFECENRHLAPGHVERIKLLAREGFYDGIVFHRVIDGFMAQTGDVQFGHGGGSAEAGMGGSDLPDLPAEFSATTFERGTVGMARSQDPNSANSQFFIMFAPAPHLDGQYTVVGQVVEGMDVVDALKKGDGGNGEVTSPDRMAKVTIAP